jgi:hypothetical protein
MLVDVNPNCTVTDYSLEYSKIMARRRTLDRKSNRGDYEDEDTPRDNSEEELEQSEEAEADLDLEDSEVEELVGAKPKKKKASTPRASTSSRSRARPAKSSRLKAYWGVFDHAGKLVQKFEYRARAEAEAFIADKMSGEKKPILYIQLHKEPMED